MFHFHLYQVLPTQSVPVRLSGLHPAHMLQILYSHPARMEGYRLFLHLMCHRFRHLPERMEPAALLVIWQCFRADTEDWYKSGYFCR